MKLAGPFGLLLLAACGQPSARAPDDAGGRLEAAARQVGLIADPTRGALTGSWALETDRACIVPGRDGPGGADRSRIGVLIDYGEGQGCAASGTVERDGERLTVRLRDCTVAARFDGERIVFAPEAPPACAALCTGRATLDAFTVARVSESRSEAATLRTPRGRPLCAG